MTSLYPRYIKMGLFSTHEREEMEEGRLVVVMVYANIL